MPSVISVVLSKVEGAPKDPHPHYLVRFCNPVADERRSLHFFIFA